jgi:D-tagatose-1,6-bisphosphate aldolase subunit GatZ/KbaZ
VSEHAVTRFRQIIGRNRENGAEGMFSVCSAHPAVLEAAMGQALNNDSVVCIESTSNQANQFGGYTRMTPAQFGDYVMSIASRVGLPRERILLGGDHLGPYPWRGEPGRSALEKAGTLVQCCVSAGYSKIHLDASMACADDDGGQVGDETVAVRAAELCRVAEDASATLPKKSAPLVYVIGTEVPVPGGETAADGSPKPTSVEHMRKTLEITRNAFVARGLEEAWERVVGLVVQPGVEFGNEIIFDYDREKAVPLTKSLPESPALVYEAHSTDYQKATALRELVEDHFAILKVGPWLTFAYREAVFALASLEREWLGSRQGIRLSHVREALEEAMLRNPIHWKAYYPAEEPQAHFARQYSYSDRCRYYWTEPSVQKEIDVLLANLSKAAIPLALLSQYMPQQYEAIRRGELKNGPESLIENRISEVLRLYSAACERGKG